MLISSKLMNFFILLEFYHIYYINYFIFIFSDYRLKTIEYQNYENEYF